MNAPQPLKLLWKGWMAFSHVLGIIMSTLILTILWIVGFGLYAVIVKLVTFPARFHRETDSFWITTKSDPVENMHYPF